MIPKVVNHAILDRNAISPMSPSPVSEPAFAAPPQPRTSCKISKPSVIQRRTFAAISA